MQQITRVLGLAACLALGTLGASCEEEAADLGLKPLAGAEAGRAVGKQQAAARETSNPGVHGTVVDARGAPIPGAHVRLGQRYEDVAEPVQTDASGRFSFDHKMVDFQLWVDHPGYLPRFFMGALPGDEDVRIAMPDAGSLVVEVVTPDGSPALEGRVWVPSPAPADNGRVGRVGHQAAQGTHVITVPTVPVGSVELDIDARGWAPVKAKVDIAARTETRVKVAVAPTKSLAGRILDARGKPVTGAEVFAAPTSGEAGAKALSDARGQFVLEGLGDSKRRITASVEGQALVAAEGEAAKPLELRLPRLATVTGRISHEGGSLVRSLYCASPMAANLRVGPEGRFTCRADPDAKTLELQADHWPVSVPVRLKEGATVDVGDVKVPGAKRGPVGTLAGEVVYEEKPFQGFQLTASDGESPAKRVVTDARGRFTFADLPAGTWQVHGKDASHLLQASALVKAGQTTRVRWEAEPAGTIVLRVKGATKPLVCDLKTDGHSLSVFEETVVLESQPVGLHSFQAKCRSQTSDKVTIVVKPGEVSQVLLEVR